MNLLPKTKEEFSQKDYWDKFFKKRGKKAFEWYGEYPELAKYLHKYLKLQDNILIVGCGSSTLGKDLYDVGCRNITNIDISKIVIKQMQSQTDKERPGLKYIQMDALHTDFKNEEFNVIIDKGTLDALMPDQAEGTLKTINQYFSEIQRILKYNGRYICISLLQEHILQWLLSFFPSNNWMFRAIRCYEPEIKSAENGENAMPVFMVVCTKFKLLPRQILELNLGAQETIQKCESVEEVAKHVISAQKAAFICSALQKSSMGVENEITLELYDQRNQALPRYNVYVVESEVTSEVKRGSYAAFIVPEGREAEWLFSTKIGRKKLVSMTSHNRLTIVTMHRGQKYDSLDSVKEELEGVVRNLAPANFNLQKIAFLTLGSDLGKRTVIHEGTSAYSGDYVIEDVEHDDGQKYRRLFYLTSQLVIQSEAKLKTIKTRNGKRKDIIDLATLTCQHHIYMSIATYLVAKEKANVVVLGLGGGGLCSFLRKFLAGGEITAIEIDAEMLKIAKQWFDFALNEKLKAIIQDGLDYIQELDNEGSNVDALLCDVDNKSSDIGMSCPPKEFIAPNTLEKISKAIGSKGIFVVNLVLRDTQLRPGIIATFQKTFKTIVSYKLSEDLNEVFLCTNIEESNQFFMDKLKRGAEAINTFFKKNNVQDEVHVDDYVGSLKINS
ncbi:eEF1A lysine and N-terminal methyltransferase homolog isoform X1 [Euwallacea fornicatus]|uniref:eEF1A lysine and N-terminal methyltransferase homolog isoform X1 n=2 Tax=Euwallacea fornicatus TaxID=995702 RepID=UPI00338DFA1C